MRAKEYLKMYEDNHCSKEILFNILNMFWAETVEIFKSRRCKTNDACTAVLKEQDDKWRSFASKSNLSDIGYMRLIEKTNPGLFSAWMSADARKEIRRSRMLYKP